MRTFGTIVFGFFFILAFNALFITHSVGGYPLSASAVTNTMRAVDLHGALMKAVDLGMQEAVSESEVPQLASDVKERLGGTLEDAIPEEWVYETFEKAYEGFISYLEGSDEVVTIDLSSQKEQIRDFFDKLVSDYGAGSSPADIKEKVEEAMKVVPDEVSVQSLIAKSGNDNLAGEKLEEAREAIGTFKTVRLAGLIGVLVLFGLIALIASSSRRRVLVSLGMVLLLSAGSYLALSNVGGGLLLDEIHKDQAQKSSGGAADDYGREVATKVVDAMFNDAFGRLNMAAGALAFLGLGMFVGGLIISEPVTYDPGGAS